PLVREGQSLQLLTVTAPVEHEVVAPHLVRSRRRLRARTASGNALPRSLSRHLQLRHTPQPMCPAEAHLMAIAAEEDADASVAVARILRRKLPHAREYSPALRRRARPVAQRRACDIDDRPRRAVRDR